MKILSLYLPQFHQIPENDEWWGKGFTEWVNVKKAKPLFENHNQPRVPLNENYYDLSDVINMKKQVKIAKKYGIYGFCVYHYWFNGHLLLEKPMENYLANKDIDFPFCFCWANEHWTNAWVSGENKILIQQDFNDEKDWVDHFNYLLPFFKDNRYIKENNKIKFVIYYPSIIEKLKEFMDCWNNLAKQNGFEGFEFIYQHYLFHLDRNKTNERKLFDYGIEFQPNLAMNQSKNLVKRKIELLRAKISNFLQTKMNIYIKIKQHNVEKFNYDCIWKKILSSKGGKNLIPGSFVDWDNTSRRGLRGSCMIENSVEKFKKYFELQVKDFRTKYKTEYLIMFSWNEWAEGGYLEPDEKNKYGYLEAIYEILNKYNELPGEK